MKVKHSLASHSRVLKKKIKIHLIRQPGTKESQVSIITGKIHQKEGAPCCEIVKVVNPIKFGDKKA